MPPGDSDNVFVFWKRWASDGLPTLASVNHVFDASTPGGPNNNASNGNGLGSPAPPRDARGEIGNLLECFQF